MRLPRVWPSACAALLVLSATVARGGDTGPAQLVEQAIAAAPQRVGLCIHLGAGSAAWPTLAAELAVHSRMLVHALAIDDASAERARAAIEAAGVAGQASVEKAALAPLPYLSNMANLAIIDGWESVARAGLTREEVLRVLAPGATLCIRDGDRWAQSVKPRPKEFDDWPHPLHDVGLTRCSKDRAFTFPIGLHWTDGVPNNIQACTDCRGWIVAKGTLFTLSSAEAENLGQRSPGGCDLWLTARDAFNGLPQWKLNTHIIDNGVAVRAANVPPLAADDESVYVAWADNQVVRVDGRTGKIVWRQAVKYPVYRLLLSEGVVVVAAWSTKNNNWYYYFPSPDSGVLAAFDAQTGAPLWQSDITAEQMAASEGAVVIQTAAKVAGVRSIALRTGRPLWQVEQTDGDAPQLELVGAGPKYVVVNRILGKKQAFACILSAATGAEIRKSGPTVSAANWAPVVDGLLWFGGRRLDPQTWEDHGATIARVGRQHCTPHSMTGSFVLGQRCAHTDLSQALRGGRAEGVQYYGARAACIEGMIVANGMLYTAQNGCRCVPSHLCGFLCLAPCGAEPTVDDFAKPKALERGPAFATELPPGEPDNSSAWPMLRADPRRSASSASRLPAELKETWRVQLLPTAKGPLADAWDSQFTSPLSAPVAAEGLVFVSACDQGQIVACAQSDGRRVWTATLAGRLDGPPTYYRGLCLAGCHDGQLYALRAKDGKLAWRAQLAPWPRHIVDHGRVASLWPAPASVLVHEGVVYATAGRTSESDGGIVLAALDAATGRTLWTGRIGAGAMRLNDILSLRDGQLAWRYMRFDKATGQALSPAATPGTSGARDTADTPGKRDTSDDPELASGQPKEGAMMDGTYTVARNRRGGHAFKLNDKLYDLLALNDRFAAVPRAILSTDGRQELAKVSVTGHVRMLALALADNAAVYVYRASEYAQPGAKCTLRIVAPDNGRVVQELPLPGPTAYDGLAIADGKLFVSLQDGRLLCLTGGSARP